MNEITVKKRVKSPLNAAISILFKKYLGLPQAVHTAGKLKPQGGLLGCGHQLDALGVILVADDAADAVKVHFGHGKQHLAGLLPDVTDMELLRFGTQEGANIRVTHDLTQEEIAQLVGASRETVNKALAEFAHRGWLRLEGKSVIISDTERLARRAR